jgi:hypothetical protein
VVSGIDGYYCNFTLRVRQFPAEGNPPKPFGQAAPTGLDSQEKPRRCALAPENDALTEEIRQLIYGKSRNKYRILFTIREDIVFVLHVRHRSQAPVTSEEIDEEEKRE